MRAHGSQGLRFGLEIVTGFLVLASGCVPYAAHRGTDLSTLDSQPIEKNRTRERQLVDRFGPPSNSTTQGDGSRILTWTDATSEGSVAAVPFARNSINVKSRTLTVTVRDGVVVDYRVSDGSQQM